MTTEREQRVDIFDTPVFRMGEKVCAVRNIRNDGTHPHSDIGEVLVRRSDHGYVRDIGTYLQQFRVYAVEFVDRRIVVGMRAGELTSLDAVAGSSGPNPPKSISR